MAEQAFQDAVGIGGTLDVAVVVADDLKFMVGNGVTAGIHEFHFKAEFLRCGDPVACAVDILHFLGNVQSAGLDGIIGHGAGYHGTGHGLGGTQVGAAVLGVVSLGDGICSTAGQAQDSGSLAICQLQEDADLAAVIGDSVAACVHSRTGFIGDDQAVHIFCSVVQIQIHRNGELFVCRCALCQLGHILGDLQAGGDGQGQLAVVAQPHDHFGVLMDIAGLAGGFVVGRCVGQLGGTGIVAVLVMEHIVQAADALGLDAQDGDQVGACQTVFGSVLVCQRTRLCRIHGRAAVEGHFVDLVIESHCILQIAPGGVDQVGHFLGSIAGASGTEEGNVGIDGGGIADRTQVCSAHGLDGVLGRIPFHAVLARLPGDGAAVSIGGADEDLLSRLVIVEAVVMGGNEAHVSIAQVIQAVAVQVGGIHGTEGVAVQIHRAVGLVHVSVVAGDLGGVHLTAGQQDIGIHAHGVEYTQRPLFGGDQGAGGHIVLGSHIDLVQGDGQDLLIDVNTQLLGAVSILVHLDLNVPGGIPVLTGGGVLTCAGGDGIGAVAVVHHGIGVAEELHRLDGLDLHVLADVVSIDQRCACHTGGALLGAGDGVESTGGQLLDDLIEGRAQVCAGHILIIVHIVDISRNIAGADVACRPAMVKDPGGLIVSAAGLDGGSRAFCPGGIGIPGRLHVAVGVTAVETTAAGSTGIQVNVVVAGAAQIDAHAVDRHFRAVVLLYAGLAVGSIQQCAEHDACIAAGLAVGRADGIPVIGHSPVGAAVSQHDGNRSAALGIVSVGQDTHTSVDAVLQVGTGGVAAILTQDRAAVILGCDHTVFPVGLMVVIIDAQVNAVAVVIQANNSLTVGIESNDGDPDILESRQIVQQLVGCHDHTLHTGHILAVLVIHGGGGIQHQHHVQRTAGGDGGIGGHGGAQRREDCLEILALGLIQFYHEGGIILDAVIIEQHSFAVLIDRLIHPYAARIAVAVDIGAQNIFPGMGSTGIGLDHGSRVHCCIGGQGHNRQQTQHHHQGQDHCQHFFHRMICSHM